MLEVERPKSNILQADGLRLRAVNLRLSQSLDRSKEEVAQLQARCDEFWRHLELPQKTRDEAYLSRTGVDELETGSTIEGLRLCSLGS